MRRIFDKFFELLVGILCSAAVLLLVFLVFFILRESLPAIREVGLRELLTGDVWRPVIYADAPSYGMRNMILSTLYVSILAVFLASATGIGCSLFLACGVSHRLRCRILPCIELLASIPSVVYGFIGLYTIIRFLEMCGRAAGESILAGSIVLSVMILPYMISSCCGTMVRLRQRYESASSALGVSPWYMAGELILPAARKGILISISLSTGRAMGETMAVMMVMGNALASPSLLGKGQTISALIAMEMGMAEAGSIHFSALYTAGLVLMLLLFCINLVFELLKRRLSKEGIL